VVIQPLVVYCFISRHGDRTGTVSGRRWPFRPSPGASQEGRLAPGGGELDPQHNGGQVNVLKALTSGAVTPIEPPDSLHLLAAQGWLELGNHLEANEELEKITPCSVTSATWVGWNRQKVSWKKLLSWAMQRR
jgi:hypothetical protein